MANYTQLFIEGQEVDLSGVDKIGLVYSINDIRELSNRDSDKSRTIELPGTKQNHIIFGHAFEIRGQGSFNPNKRAKALLMVNGFINMEGFCMLQDCRSKQGEDKFIIKLYGGNIDFVNAIGDDELSDLDLSEFNHNWSGANIRASWNNTEGYVYPLIEYGRFYNYNPSISGFFASNVNDYEMFPAVFVKTLIDKIFERIGYQLTGSFFADLQHRNLILPFTNKDLEHNQEWKERKDFVAKRTSFQSVTGPAKTLITYQDITGNKEGYFDSSSTFTAGEAARMKFTLQINTNNPFNETQYYRLEKNGVLFDEQNTINESFENTWEIDVYSGDEVKIYIRLITTPNAGYGINSATLASDISRTLIPGGLIRLSDNLPKLKQIDLIKTLYKMFGLIFQTDPNSKTVQIDTFNQFYKKPDAANPDSFVDWSNKLDLTGKIERQFVAETYGRNNLFKWKQDQDDSDIVDYMRTRGFPFNTGFGNGSYSINSDFLKQQEVIADLPFASTFMVSTFNGALGLPSIKRYIDGEYKGTPEPRILIYAGSVSVEALTGDPTKAAIKVDGVEVPNIGWAYFWKQRYNNAQLDSFDLNLYFDNEFVQYGTTLIDKYYSDFMNIITNLRFIKCWVTLNEVDIANLDFGKPIYISYFRTYFLLNKINDYYANQNYESCQIELLPIG